MNSILIMSDSHSMDIKEIITKENIDYVMHLGDSQLSYKELKKVDFKVKGNCDYDKKLEKEILTNIYNIGNVFLTHGHLRNVKYDMEGLKDFCIKEDIKLCLYGHTHILSVDYDEKIDLLIINPGSTAISRSVFPETYIILKYDIKKYEIIIKGAYSGKEIKKIELIRNKKNKFAF